MQMAWTEAEVDDLIKQVQRDFALGRFSPRFHNKLREHGVTIQDAERTIGKHSYIGRYEKDGKAIGFLNPRNHIFVVEFRRLSYTCENLLHGRRWPRLSVATTGN
ncbi:hypothetical protein EDS67_08015 [candidate division KSB1 bacterium]|nr:MAG: hypothetical protein EDS67_08015 [candidate division KSB1 bacterium]MBC6950467.1 hypothetical protein [candidate division KSB1 bacterium]MCE7941196.1 hypothetical protein [Chlorobi bacterium CHB1]